MSKTDEVERLWQAWQDADKGLASEARSLAYDVTFRAASPNGPGHDKASPALTAKLKEKYVAAFEAEREAFEAWDAARKVAS